MRDDPKPFRIPVRRDTPDIELDLGEFEVRGVTIKGKVCIRGDRLDVLREQVAAGIFKRVPAPDGLGRELRRSAVARRLRNVVEMVATRVTRPER